MNSKLAELIVNGTISIEELADAHEFIERAKLVRDGLMACTKTLLFPFGKNEISAYRYMDRAGEYESWGTVSRDGIFSCWCNWGGDHEIGKVDLNDFNAVFLALENSEFTFDLTRFLQEQIDKVKEE